MGAGGGSAWVRFEDVERAQNLDQVCFQDVGTLGRSRCRVRFADNFPGELAAKPKKAVEIFDGAAMEALGPGFDSQRRGGDVGLPAGAVLFEGDIDAVGEFGSVEDEWVGGPAVAVSRQLVRKPASAYWARATRSAAERSWELMVCDGVGDEAGNSGPVFDSADGEGMG